MTRKKGYYGEGVPADGGLVVAVKTHGHTTGEGMKVARPQQVEHNHHQEVNHTAILLIRNPFKAIIGGLCHHHHDITMSPPQVTGTWMPGATRGSRRMTSSRARAGRASWRSRPPPGSTTTRTGCRTTPWTTSSCCTTRTFSRTSSGSNSQVDSIYSINL